MYITPENVNDVFESIIKPTKLELKPRKTFIKMGSRGSAKGSAYVEYGKTKILAQVDPPKEMNNVIRKLNNNNHLCAVNCTIRFTAFATPENKDMTQKEIWMSLLLKKALEPMICRHEYPNFQIDIEAQILDDDGCAISAAIICGGAALVDAGIATYDLITASTIAYYKGLIFVNPDYIVEQLVEFAQKSSDIEEHGIIVVASMHSVQQISECFHLGYMSSESLLPLIDHGDEINKMILDTIRHVMADKVNEYVEYNADDDVDFREILMSKLNNDDSSEDTS